MKTVQDHIVDDNYEEAFKLLRKTTPVPRGDEIILLEARYKKMKKDIRQGIIRNSDALLEANKIRNAMLDLLGCSNEEIEEPKDYLGGEISIDSLKLGMTSLYREYRVSHPNKARDIKTLIGKLNTYELETITASVNGYDRDGVMLDNLNTEFNTLRSSILLEVNKARNLVKENIEQLLLKGDEKSVIQACDLLHPIYPNDNTILAIKEALKNVNHALLPVFIKQLSDKNNSH